MRRCCAVAVPLRLLPACFGAPRPPSALSARCSTSKFRRRRPTGSKTPPDPPTGAAVVCAAPAPNHSDTTSAPKRRARFPRPSKTPPPDAVALVAERASITKLFMVSDSVAAIFRAVPHDPRAVDGFLKGLDDAVRPADVSRRLLAEERADHALCIHVRDMEQLVPPRHLLPPAAGEKGARRAARRGKAPPPTPVERVMALHAWQKAAVAQSNASQGAHRVPEAYHVITRVRFHDQQKVDLSVVQGSGGSKSVRDVLRILRGDLQRKGTDAKGWEGEAAPALLATPYVVKPLLSVFASCVPRREPALGSRSGEETTPRPNPTAIDNSSQASSSSSSSSHTRRARGREEKRREAPVPFMPRYTTRVTVLLEHDDLEAVDLLSTPERSRARGEEKVEGKKTEGKGKMKRPHIYCLIADGGEF